MTLARRASIAVASLTCAALLAVPQALVAETTTTQSAMDHYRAYLASLNAGQLREASEHARAAWAQARTEMPDTNPNKGALAYNAAWSSVITGRAADALEPAQAAVALARADGAYGLGEARLMEGYAAMKASGTDEASAAQLRRIVDLAEPVLAADVTDTVVGMILTDVARIQLGSQLYDSAYSTANKAIQAYTKSGDVEGAVAASSYIVRAISAIGRSSSPNAARNAYRDLVQATIIWGDPGDEPSDTYHQLTSWRAAIRGIALSNGYSEPYLERQLERIDERLAARRPSDRPECKEGLRRVSRMNIDYPSEALFARRVGGAVVVAQIAADGTVESARVRGSVPGPQFGENAAEAIRGWKFEISEGLPADCRRDHTIVITYAIVP